MFFLRCGPLVEIVYKFSIDRHCLYYSISTILANTLSHMFIICSFRSYHL